MLAITDPNLIVGGYGLAILAGYMFWRFIVWVRDSPARPNPWDAETDQKLLDPETPETCPNCSTPQNPGAWFCEHCGRAVGPYNNLMPYVNAFSQGEVFRNGINGRFRNRPLIFIGFILASFWGYFVFAPVYLLMLLKSWRRADKDQTSAQKPGSH